MNASGGCGRVPKRRCWGGAASARCRGRRACRVGWSRRAVGNWVSRPGGGRKRLTVRDPTLKADLERLIEPTTRGEPESPLRWTCKSTRELTAALRDRGHRVSHTVVAELL